MFPKPHIRPSAVIGLMVFISIISCHPEEMVSPDTDNPLEESSYSQPIEGQYLVILKQGAINARFSAKGDYSKRTSAMKMAIAPILHRAKISNAVIEQVYSNTVFGFAGPLDQSMLEKLRMDPEVAYIEQDRLMILAHPKKKKKKEAPNTQETPPGITRVGGSITYSGKNVAWIIDTGIDMDHPDLNVADERGFNALTIGDDAQTLDDGNGHGTHVAGSIAAIDNKIGVVGIAAGAPVVPVKVFDSNGNGTYSGVIRAVDYVAANARYGDVANMSLGGPISLALDEAVFRASEKGIFFCLAAGNKSDDAALRSPARVNGRYAYTVSAMAQNDSWAYFSNFGRPPVDFCAPGVGIKSTWKDGEYHTISGTSMATPHVAGVLLLVGEDFLEGGRVQHDPDGQADFIMVHR
jgi:subtilisin family serine protease